MKQLSSNHASHVLPPSSFGPAHSDSTLPFESMAEHTKAQHTWESMRACMSTIKNLMSHVQLVPDLSHQAPPWHLHCVACLHAAVLLNMCVCGLR